MKTTIDIEVLGFTGFYQGIWDQSENEWQEIHEMKYGEHEDFESLHMIEDWGFPENYRDEVGKLFATEYVDQVNTLLGLDVKLIGSRISSPREYNFSTDEIYATIEIGDYDALIKRISDIASDPKYRTELADIIHRNHTSRSGFWSWMSNDIEEWFGLIVDPNNNHYVSYMIGYLMRLIDPEWFDEFNYNMYDYVECNTDLHNVSPITDIAKDEWELYEQFGSLYTKYADEHPLRYPDKWEWEDYKEEFLAHVDEYAKKLKRKEFDKKYQLCLNFEDL